MRKPSVIGVLSSDLRRKMPPALCASHLVIIKKVEAGQVNVTLRTLSRIADALSVDIGDLFQ